MNHLAFTLAQLLGSCPPDHPGVHPLTVDELFLTSPLWLLTTS